MAFRFQPTWIAFALVAGAMVWSVARVWRQTDTARGAVVEIGFGHAMVQSGVPEAYQAIIDRYQALRPGVRVKQHGVPERVVAQWIKTQLLSDDPPDVLAHGTPYGVDDTMLAEHYLALDRWLQEPNPYNLGTPLEGIPWRETFLGALDGHTTYRPNLAAYYGVGTHSQGAGRIFYNADLLRRVGGSEVPPRDLREYLDLARRLERHNAQTGEQLVLLTGGTRWVILESFTSQTQALADRIDLNRDGNTSSREAMLAFKEGAWNAWSPEIQNALEISRRIAATMKAAEYQDAMLHFMQGQAVAFWGLSREFSTLLAYGHFRLTTGPIPIPGPDDPEFGRFAYGPRSMQHIQVAVPLGLTRKSRHPEVAVDFLRFLTSHAAVEEFCRLTSNIPAVLEVPTNEIVRPFLPEKTGGFGIGIWLQTMGADIHGALNRHFHLLTSNSGGLAAFTERFAPALATAVDSDLQRDLRTSDRSTRLLDGPITALSVQAATDSDALRRFRALVESQSQQEIDALLAAALLERSRSDAAASGR